jgi:membrane-associated protease RseP (regulator of RpoE activity)
MKRFLIFLILASIVLAPAVLAKDKPRTIIVRDGQLLDFDEGWGEFAAGKRAFLGVSAINLTEELRELYVTDRDAGVLVGDVEANSPAAKAGLRVGDIIVAIDGKDIVSSADLRRTLRGKKEGDTARIDVVRNKSRQTVVATLVERDFGGLFAAGDMAELQKRLNTTFNSPEWRARVERLPRLSDCGELQSRIRELETRLKDLEKKLNK